MFRANHHNEFYIKSGNINYWFATDLTFILYTWFSVESHALHDPGKCLEMSAAIKVAQLIKRSHWEHHANMGKRDTLFVDREPRNPTIFRCTYPYVHIREKLPLLAFRIKLCWFVTHVGRSCPGARFSKAPETKKSQSKSRTLWSQSCFIRIILTWTEVLFIQEVSGAYNSPFLDTDETKMAPLF